MLHCLAPKEQPIRSGREGMLHMHQGQLLPQMAVPQGLQGRSASKGEGTQAGLLLVVVGTRLEEVVTGHARLPGHAGRDDDQVSIFEGSCQLVIASVALQKQVVGGQREL